MTPQQARAASFRKSLGDAILGTRQDLTEGSIGRAITLLAIPMVLEMMMQSLFGLVDIFFVARLGNDSVAAVALTESLFTPVFAICMGLGMATTAMVARRIGEKDPKAASKTAVQSIGVGVILSIVLGLAGALLAPQLLQLMGASPHVVETGSTYSSIVLGGTGTILLLFLMNAIFRGAGDAAVAMRVLWLANIVNMILVPCLIRGWGPFPRLGLTGAAIGTTLGRGLAVLYQVWMLLAGSGRVKIARAQIHLDADIMRRLLRVALTGIVQYSVATASWLALMRIMATFASAALAGYSIAVRVILFAILPSWGMANAAATMVGQNLGAGKPHRAESAVWRTAFCNMLFLGSIAALFILFAENIIRFFTNDPAVIRVGVDCLRFVSYGYPFFAFGMVMVQSFNGAGDTRTPTLINFFCYWLWEIPLAYTLALRAGLGPRGVFLAIAIAESTSAVVGVLMFRRGRWKQLKI